MQCYLSNYIKHVTLTNHAYCQINKLYVIVFKKQLLHVRVLCNVHVYQRTTIIEKANLRNLNSVYMFLENITNN